MFTGSVQVRLVSATDLSYPWSAESSDADLVAIARAGDAEGFEELYRRYAGRALRVAQKITRNEHDAHDAVAEAVAKVLQVVKSRPPSAEIAFWPYLRVATRNAALDIVRRRARIVPTNDGETLDGDSGIDRSADPVVAEEEDRIVLEALRGLSPREQVILWLVVVEGAPLRLAADMLGLKPNHIAQLAMRSRKRLRRGFLLANVRNHAPPDCQFTVRQLPLLVDDDLRAQSLSRIEGHLATCHDCRLRLDDLKDLTLTRRRGFLPLLALLWKPFTTRRRGRRDVVPSGTGGTSPDTYLQGGASAAKSPVVEHWTSMLTDSWHGLTHTLSTVAPSVHQVVAALSAPVLVVGLSLLDPTSNRSPGARQAPIYRASPPPLRRVRVRSTRRIRSSRPVATSDSGSWSRGSAGAAPSVKSAWSHY